MTGLEGARERIATWVAEIKEAGAEKKTADARVDQESLDRAADLETIYQSMEWVEDMPTPKRGRGRPIDPKSREQFAKWVNKTYDWGTKQRLAQLQDAASFVNGQNLVDKTTEWTTRPLFRLRAQGYGDHMGEVWQQVCSETNGRPTNSDVRRVVKQFLDKRKAPIPNAAADPRTAREKRKAKMARLIADFDALMADGNRTAQKALAEMKEHFNKHQAEIASLNEESSA